MPHQRTRALLLLLYVAATGGLVDGDAAAADDPSASASAAPGRRVSCDDIAEVWRDLCRERRCEPREDGGCRKRSASGDCSTMRGCVQGNDIEGLKDWVPVLTPPAVPAEVEYIRLAGMESQNQRYLNLVEPPDGHRTAHAEGLRVVVHLELFVSPRRLASIAAGSPGGDALVQGDAHGEGQGGREGEEEGEGVLLAGTQIIIAPGADDSPSIVVSVDGVPWLRMPADGDDAGDWERHELKATLLEDVAASSDGLDDVMSVMVAVQVVIGQADGGAGKLIDEGYHTLDVSLSGGACPLAHVTCPVTCVTPPILRYIHTYIHTYMHTYTHTHTV